MSMTVATLPTGSDPELWSPEEAALVEAAGLVAVDARTGAKTRAPRPVVAAFLQHAARTGLDPFARQIYCLARKSKGEYKWTTQVSIDGARLVAERTGQYEGQTTPEFTADGVTWTQVWLSPEMPRAARVGVYRRGFRDALYAIALWEAYAVYQDEWSNGSKTGRQSLSAMWAKMGPLMLAKCAEMLALRKAFPQDLSGLYSTEEMDQAGAPREVVKQAEAPVQGSPATAVVQTAIAAPVQSRDWASEAASVTDLAALTKLAEDADRAGELGLRIGLAGDNDDGSAFTVMDVLRARKSELEQPVQVPLVEVEKPKKAKRNWLGEAKAAETADQLRAVWMEANASGATADVLDEIDALAASLPEASEPESPGEGWAAEGDGASSEGWAGDEPSMVLGEGETVI